MNCQRIFQKLKDEENLIYALDQYDQYGVLNLYSEIEENIEDIANQHLHEFKLKGIYLKQRLGEGQVESKLVAGEDAPDEYEVVENDLKFLIRIKDYLDVGLFLDHRPSREIIKSESQGKRVLNLFSYTASFSVYAASGGAKSTTSVDLSKTYSEWAKKNFEINNLDVNFDEGKQTQNDIWQMDVMEFIKLAEETREIYDIIILDPPSFSRNKSEVFNVQKDHRDLIKRLQDNLLATGGFLFFSTNLKSFILDDYIRPGAEKLTKKTIPKEFLPYKPHQSFVFYN